LAPHGASGRREEREKKKKKKKNQQVHGLHPHANVASPISDAEPEKKERERRRKKNRAPTITRISLKYLYSSEGI